MSESYHLIQPVGFSLPNIVCALAHDKIQSATLLFTDEVSVAGLDRAIALANQLRETPLSDCIKQRIESPSAPSLAQFQTLSSIACTDTSEIVVGVTGGTQRVMGTLISRYGSDRVLWVERGPIAVLAVAGIKFPAEFEFGEDDYKLLYALESIPISSDSISVVKGALTINRNMCINDYPSGGSDRKKLRKSRTKWAKNLRQSISQIVYEIGQLENKIGRLGFRYNLIIAQPTSEITSTKATPILSRIPDTVNVIIRDQPLVDGINRLSIQGAVTESFVESNVYELPISFRAISNWKPGNVLHVMIDPSNSIQTANIIFNHKPDTLCLWMINHESDDVEILRLCSQAFTLHGWLTGKLAEYFGIDESILTSKPPHHLHDITRIFLINSNVDNISEHASELSARVQDSESVTLDVSNGTGMISGALHRHLSDQHIGLHVTYTHPWSGEISFLNSEEVQEGQPISIIDRFWLTQRPIISYEQVSTLTDEQNGLLNKIARRSRISDTNRYTLPTDSWDGVVVKEVKKNKKPFLHFNEREAELSLLKPTKSQGFWLDDLLKVSLGGLDNPLDVYDAITSVKLLTDNTTKHHDVEIDGIVLGDSGLSFISCKAGKGVENPTTLIEAIAWSRSLGGPNSRPIILHDSRDRLVSQEKVDRTIVAHYNWPSFVLGESSDELYEEE